MNQFAYCLLLSAYGIKCKKNMALVTFRVKKSSPRSWQVSQSSVFAKTESGVIKEINYFKGRDSIFVEDNEKIKPSLVPAFEFNEMTERTELVFDDVDKNLYDFLTNHGHFDRRFELFNSKAETERELSEFEQIDQATLEITGRKGAELKALGLLVIGMGAMSFEEKTIQLKLRKLAMETPTKLLNVTKDSAFEKKYLGALGLVSGVLKFNAYHTAVVWADNDGEVVSIGQGENGLEKLGALLSKNNETAISTLQAIADKINEKANVEQSEGKKNTRSKNK